MQLTVVVVVLLAGAFSAHAGRYDTYIPRDSSRTGTEAVAALKDSPRFTEFEKELRLSRQLIYAELAAIARAGKLVTRACGSCALFTAGIDRASGTSVYWRKVKPEEPVTGYVRNEQFVPLFLKECGNPVRPIETALRVEPLEGCVDGTVSHSTGYWQNPGSIWHWGSAGQGYSYTTSHHRGAACTWYLERGDQ